MIRPVRNADCRCTFALYDDVIQKWIVSGQAICTGCNRTLAGHRRKQHPHPRYVLMDGIQRAVCPGFTQEIDESFEA